jgi:hypothetical protein
MLIELNEQDLLSRMRNFEDHFVERKTAGDSKDWIKTVVAFANSAPDDYPCVLYIGVKDSGEIESPTVNLDTVQKSFNREMKKIYPAPPYVPKIIGVNGQQALAIIVLGSKLRPHFAGPSYIRKGSETIEASNEQFDELIARRSSKANKILTYQGRNVTVINRQPTATGHTYESVWPDTTVVTSCNQFWVTLVSQPGNPGSSFPLSRVEISFDEEKKRLRLEIER